MKVWPVQLICCGRDDGYQREASWEAAFAFSTSYTNPTPHQSHVRQAIIMAPIDAISCGWVAALPEDSTVDAGETLTRPESPSAVDSGGRSDQPPATALLERVAPILSPVLAELVMSAMGVADHNQPEVTAEHHASNYVRLQKACDALIGAIRSSPEIFYRTPMHDVLIDHARTIERVPARDLKVGDEIIVDGIEGDYVGRIEWIEEYAVYWPATSPKLATNEANGRCLVIRLPYLNTYRSLHDTVRRLQIGGA